jgi:hypothetical protein
MEINNEGNAKKNAGIKNLLRNGFIELDYE